MASKLTVAAAIQEAKELKELFDRIKEDTEEFLTRAKALSETGASEAKDMIELVKNNWKDVLAGFAGGSSFASIFSGTGNEPKEAGRPRTAATGSVSGSGGKSAAGKSASGVSSKTSAAKKVSKKVSK